LKSLLWSFGNSVQQHEARSIRGSRTINNDVTAFQQIKPCGVFTTPWPGAWAAGSNGSAMSRKGQHRVSVVEFLEFADALGFDPRSAIRRISAVKG
jgi:hypothetical protein